MDKRRPYILPIFCFLFLASCSGNGDKGSRSPILLGDSSSIVTETDPKLIQDRVSDLHPEIPSKVRKDEDEQAPHDTAKAVAPAPVAAAPADGKKPPVPATQPVAPGKGLNIPFKEVSVTIPDIAVRSYHAQDPAKLNGVSYQLVTGNINNNRIIINSGNVTKVSMRYMSRLVVSNRGENLILDDVNTTTDWQPLTGAKNIYTIKGLETARLEAPEFTASALRNAVTKAARRKRLNHKREKEYQASVRAVRRAGQPPVSVSLRSVMLKIDGKDAAGKMFSKQIRVDLP